jgi:hypothetical protein
MLKWAREHDCPWDKAHVRRYAVNRGHVAVLTWLNEQGDP